MEHATVASAVIAVSDIDRSADFYRDVFACRVSVKGGQAALLLSPGGFQLYLVERGARAQHPLGGIGVQYLMWSTDSRAALDEFERALRTRGCHTLTHARGGVDFVEGRDPDGIRVVIAHPSPDELPRDFLDNRLYQT